MKVEWKQALLVAGGAAAASAALYFLLREERSDSHDIETEGKKKISKHDATTGQVLAILKDILASQEKMKILMKRFTQEFFDGDYTFDQAYAIVDQQHPDDPLERYGLSMSDFDALLDKFQDDPQIKESVLKILGSSTPPHPTEKSMQLSKAKIVEVHEFMRDELVALVDQVQKRKSHQSPDMKVITLAAQAFVGARVQKRFDLTSEDVETAVLMNHKELGICPEFARVNMAIQGTMNQLIGSDMM